jgi:coiled-coil and C2 domain-containing protein 2A
MMRTFLSVNFLYFSEEVVGNELISIQLFDEIVVDVLADERLRDIDVHTRHERAWLGTITIPFSAVQRSSKVGFVIRFPTPTFSSSEGEKWKNPIPA